MNLLVVGGGLQGLEILYLIKKTSSQSTLIDKKNNVLAKKLADNFLCLDIFSSEFENIVSKYDVIIPALENSEALLKLVELCAKKNIVLAFDWEAYRISSDKILSKKFFNEVQIPTALGFVETVENIWPQIAKPKIGSGSQGVVIFNNKNDYETWKKLLEKQDKNWQKNWLIEQYLEGALYSIEIVGSPNNYVVGQVTSLNMDANYDCNKIQAPSGLNDSEIKIIEEIALKTASNLNLKGLMDLEFIKHNNKFYVMEIDARFPSQTPITVYHSSGRNLLEDLLLTFTNYEKKYSLEKKEKFVSYEHLSLKDGHIYSPGECYMKVSDSLGYKKNYLGADEVLISGKIIKGPWCMVAISKASTLLALENKRKNIYNNLKKLK